MKQTSTPTRRTAGSPTSAIPTGQDRADRMVHARGRLAGRTRTSGCQPCRLRGHRHRPHADLLPGVGIHRAVVRVRRLLRADAPLVRRTHPPADADDVAHQPLWRCPRAGSALPRRRRTCAASGAIWGPSSSPSAHDAWNGRSTTSPPIGVKLIEDPTEIDLGGGASWRYAYFRDPDGQLCLCDGGQGVTLSARGWAEPIVAIRGLRKPLRPDRGTPRYRPRRCRRASTW